MTAESEDASTVAQVILRSAASDPSRPPVTAGDVAHALPDPAVVRRVQAYFRDQGFEVGRPFATSFSLVGRRSAFAATFGPAAGEFDLSRLPAEIRDAVQAVVLTPPPAFGPGNP